MMRVPKVSGLAASLLRCQSKRKQRYWVVSVWMSMIVWSVEMRSVARSTKNVEVGAETGAKKGGIAGIPTEKIGITEDVDREKGLGTDLGIHLGRGIRVRESSQDIPRVGETTIDHIENETGATHPIQRNEDVILETEITITEDE